METFRSIRYATAGRFCEPVMCTCDDLPASCPEKNHIIAPQDTQSLNEIVFPEDRLATMSEDCLRLSVYTPSTKGSRPVLVWLHGGAFTTGGSELDAYEGSSLCESQDIVIVCASYRLGALGYLHDKDKGIRDLGLKDQICALEWVHSHIHLFGGDPERVTLAGQSAGAYSVQCIISSLRKPLFHRAIIMSTPFHMSMSERKAARISASFERHLGKDKFSADISEVLSAQARVCVSSGPGLVFMPVCGTSLKDGVTPSLKEVLLTTQRDDGGPFTPVKALTPLVTWAIFRQPVGAYMKALSRYGVKASHMELSWRHGESPLGATHAAEVPLLFGNYDLWKDVPMVRGASEQNYNTNRAGLQGIIGEFVRK